MTRDQIAVLDRKKAGVVNAARVFVAELVKQRPTKSLRLARARLEIVVVELEVFELEHGIAST